MRRLRPVTPRARRRIAGRVVVVIGASLALGACGGSAAGRKLPAPQAAPSAADPGCVRLLSRLPSHLLGQERNAEAVRGVARWGEVVLRCGVTPPAPTTDSCIDTDGVDWVFEETDQVFRFVTYGRTPAVEVTVPVTVPRERAPGAMTGLRAAIEPIPQTRRCL